ncbi:MAG TPA: hypothetical protein DDW65_04245 [Firmicutes bacterium]|jgi:hypothetical protein|nr:hypothetical protein [Bacillota bacterium]
MFKFGFASSLLKIPTRFGWRNWIPEKLLYSRGPLKVGEIVGSLPEADIRGLGWQLPGNAQIWDNSKIFLLWQRFLQQLELQEIRLMGLEPGTFTPPPALRNQTYFPGVSDGKALELLLFINRFRSILRNYEITPQKAKAMVVWEEGNLGVTCARLIAREVRFLNLVSPNARSLERAAELVFAETGISSQIYLTLPEASNGTQIVIKCGRLTQLKLVRNSKRAIWCELFQKCPSLSTMNADLPVAVRSKFGGLPLYPALGETILRSFFDLSYGFWYGNELPLERVLKLATCFRELGKEIAV